MICTCTLNKQPSQLFSPFMNVCLVSFCTLRRAETQGAAAAVPALKSGPVASEFRGSKKSTTLLPAKKRKKRNASNHTIFSDKVPPFER